MDRTITVLPTSITYFASDDFMEEEPDEKELDINCL